ncbi:tripartite motif-containing protein 75-like [Perognathus longimembris pacificus]|uniref:tripartite motif-containing protein 75-like n=1 Tax=Perognathus longimembris pacificus TaxID=214514 RepID=UPI0020194D34|nr:tripartite motif-containing protein 75-like [Perognathus longimembris pacificus]
MEAKAALAEFREGSKCPICLEDLGDPVTIECGHNFCRACIQQSWEQLKVLSCPVCRQECKEGRFWSNDQLGNMIEIAQNFVPSPSKKRKQERPLCVRHKEELLLFCEDDLVLLCHQCVPGGDHQSHRVRPIEEAAAEHRLKLQSSISSLKSQVREGQKVLADHYKKLVCLEIKVETQRQKLTTESSYWNMLVKDKHDEFLSMVQKQQEQNQEQVEVNRERLECYCECAEELIKEIVEKSKLPEVRLLTHVKSILHKCDSLEAPDFHSAPFKREHCSIYRPLSAVQRTRKKFQVEVLLDPHTAHPNLWVSEDKKSVMCVQTEQTAPPYPMQLMDYPIILGAARFTSGRHFWEVQVEDKEGWTIGVCKDYVCTDTKRPHSGPSKYWAIQLCNGYLVARNTAIVQLSIEKPIKVGVYLDYELGEVSFYNTDAESHIYTFMDEFSETLIPFFCIGFDSKPLTLC